jgi:hypothetical protein
VQLAPSHPLARPLVLQDALLWMTEQGRANSDSHVRFTYRPAGGQQFGCIACEVLPEGQLGLRVQEALERAVLKYAA